MKRRELGLSLTILLSILSLSFKPFKYTDVSKLNSTTTIEYDVYWNGTIKTELLTFNNEKSISQSFLIKEKISSASIMEDGVYKLNSNGKIASLIEHYRNVDSDTIYMKAVINDFKSVTLLDVVPEIEWEIDSSVSKKFNGYTMSYATGEFRGSNIFAWFTTDIPVSIGPWKFDGLPGAILECGDIDKTYVWTATKIRKSKDQNLDFQNLSLESVGTYKEFILSKIERNAKNEKLTNSRLPQGVTMGKSRTIRKGIEKIYEWETTNEKK